ncbi:hypothetical protein FPHYL_8436 [Fusarium phyllophilum]|uniref:Uncharacterized protein n=1 Tax=Fusarium phyllophilum TaxID=47803 RepID=A0A8H5JH59_9HYPO|nr:hypothetical protein FPHYL_8436 [Fusarium phyllophilum]
MVHWFPLSTSQAASDGDDEGAVLKTLKSRKATSAFHTPSQVVIATYNHEDKLNTNDEPHEVPVHGTYFTKYVRASRLLIPRDGAKHMPDRLPVEIPGPESATPTVYVGIAGVAIKYVFMRDKTKVNKVSFADNTESFDLRAEPSNVVAGINTIFHEDKATVFEEQPAPMARLVRQNNRVLQYLPVEPLQNLKIRIGCIMRHLWGSLNLLRSSSTDSISSCQYILWTRCQQNQQFTLYLYFMSENSDNLESEVFGRMPAVDLEMTRRLGWKQMGGIEANNMRVELALRLGKKLEDLVYDRNQMVFKWDGMIHEVMNAMAEGSLPNVGDIESLTTNGTITQETTADPEEPPVSSDEPVDVQELEILGRTERANTTTQSRSSPPGPSTGSP